MYAGRYVPHDAQFTQLCADPTRTFAALWPSDSAISVQDLKDRADRDTQGRITLIAVDATWNGARHLAGSYPTDMLKVKLDLDSVFGDGEKRSLMAPLRKYTPNHDDYVSRCALPSRMRILCKRRVCRRASMWSRFACMCWKSCATVLQVSYSN
jgi:hypothetical protein